MSFSFTVVDRKTGGAPDEWEIAANEEWAKGLMWPDMDGFALTQDGSLVLLDECGRFSFCPEDRFIVTIQA